jgi:serine/threonine protein phosphatase PrpC
MKAVAFGISERGHVRKTNEDAVLADDELQLFVVADGMGGHRAGEVASRLAVEAVEGFIRRSAEGGEFSWPYGIRPSWSFDANRLHTAIHLANRRVFRAAESHDDYTGMGTTVVTALLNSTHIVVGHVGDSRLYRSVSGALERLTEDDSWLATVLGQDDGQAHAGNPMRHVLTNVLGAREQTDIHIREVPRRPGERLLLCSDGVHAALADDVIARCLTESALEDAARALVTAALDAGSRDNVSAVVVDCRTQAAA